MVSHVVACFFHLAQSIWRHVQQFELVNSYMTKVVVKQHVKYLAALAYVPVADVPQVYALLDNSLGPVSKIAPTIVNLYSYFQETYIGDWKHGVCSKPAYFPPSEWNQLSRLSDDLPRTDNKHEAWHRVFSQTLNASNPGLYDCLDQLKSEQAEQETIVSDFEQGLPV